MMDWGCPNLRFKMVPLARPISVKMIPLARLNSTSKVPCVGVFLTKISKYLFSLEQNHQNFGFLCRN